jgi:hypothetical protein
MQPVRGKIYVIDKGRMGNAMFMYAVARALHELLGFELELEAGLVGKLGSFEGISSLPAQVRPATWQPQGSGLDLTIVRHQVVDLFSLAADRSARTITLDGYAHQMRSMKHLLAACRRWFTLKDPSTGFNGPALPAGGAAASDAAASSPITPRDVVMHLRAGDITPMSVEEARRGGGSGLVAMPFWWFDGALRSYLGPPWGNRTSDADRGKRLLAITEPGGDGGDAAKRLKAELGAIVVSRSQSEDFSALMHADVMIGSCSTFSWWAAALRQKSQVHMPAFGVCDPRWKVVNSGAEEIDYDAGIAGWQWHDLFEMPNKPPGFDRGYGV